MMLDLILDAYDAFLFSTRRALFFLVFWVTLAFLALEATFVFPTRALFTFLVLLATFLATVFLVFLFINPSLPLAFNKTHVRSRFFTKLSG